MIPSGSITNGETEAQRDSICPSRLPSPPLGWDLVPLSRVPSRAGLRQPVCKWKLGKREQEGVVCRQFCWRDLREPQHRHCSCRNGGAGTSAQQEKHPPQWAHHSDRAYYRGCCCPGGGPGRVCSSAGGGTWEEMLSWAQSAPAPAAVRAESPERPAGGGLVALPCSWVEGEGRRRLPSVPCLVRPTGPGWGSCFEWLGLEKGAEGGLTPWRRNFVRPWGWA